MSTEIKHAFLSPSAAAAWLACAGRQAMCEGIPEEKSIYAEEGTRAHEQARQAVVNLTGSGYRQDLEGDPEMIECAAEWAHQVVDACGGLNNMERWDTEYFIPMDSVIDMPDAGGTADFVCRTYDNMLVVADFKYGKGVKVSADHNPQLMLYALGLCKSGNLYGSNAKYVRTMIYQPRLDKRPQWFEFVPSKLDDFYSVVKTAVDKNKTARELKRTGGINAVANAGYLVPGEEQCRFCRAKHLCPALREEVKAQVRKDFDVIPIAPESEAESAEKLPVPVTGEEISRALPWLDLIESWCDSVRSAAVSTMQAGYAVPGYKLVAGRKGQRKWTKDAEDRLIRMRIGKKILFEKKLISPTKAERLFKQSAIGPTQWKTLQAFITQSDGNPTIAKASDPRPAIVTVREEFKVLPPAKAEQEEYVEEPLF